MTKPLTLALAGLGTVGAGVIVGAGVGLRDFSAVGLYVKVGRCVGSSVGGTVGHGVCVGASEGTGVGSIDGSRVGTWLKVGGGVGVQVGGAVYWKSTNQPGLKAAGESPNTDLHWSRRREQ